MTSLSLLAGRTVKRCFFVVVDLLFIVAPIVGILYLVFALLFSTLCPTGFAISLMGKKGLVALLELSS